jgi:hypothetical protein
LDLTGLLQNSVLNAVGHIALGREGLATKKREAKGREAYELGLSEASQIFDDVRNSANAESIISAEYYFLVQELGFCHQDDTDSRSSLQAAVQNFHDALKCLEIVKNKTAYKKAALTHSTSPRDLIDGCPKDIFHQACNGHRTRLRNMLRTPGTNMLEKSVLKKRLVNLTPAQNSYLVLQKKALSLS